MHVKVLFKGERERRRLAGRWQRSFVRGCLWVWKPRAIRRGGREDDGVIDGRRW